MISTLPPCSPPRASLRDSQTAPSTRAALRRRRFRWTTLGLVPLIALGCSVGGGRKSPTSSPLVGSVGTQLAEWTLKNDDSQVQAARLGPLDDPTLARVTALAFDPEGEVFYGVVGTDRSVELVRFDRKRPTELTRIGPIQVKPRGTMAPWVAEALVWDPQEGDLLVAASKLRHTPISSVLLRVDPETAEARIQSEIQGTEQNEADALALAGDTLLAIDNVVGRAKLYWIDLETGEARALGKSFTPAIEALAFDADTGSLFGIARGPGQLVRLVPGDDGTPRVLEVHPLAAEDASGVTLTSTSGPGDAPSPWPGEVPQGPEIFDDGFESGTTGRWSRDGGSKD